jgi:hypothetical protein
VRIGLEIDALGVLGTVAASIRYKTVALSLGRTFFSATFLTYSSRT